MLKVASTLPGRHEADGLRTWPGGCGPAARHREHRRHGRAAHRAVRAPHHPEIPTEAEQDTVVASLLPRLSTR